MDVNTQDKSFFITIRHWQQLNKQHGQVYLDPQENRFYRLIEKINDTDYTLQALDSDSPIMADIGDFLSIETFMEQNNQQMAAQNRDGNRTKTGRNQTEISVKSGESQHAVREISGMDHKQLKVLTGLLQDYFNTINSQISDSKKPDVEAARMEFLSGLEAGNLKLALRNLDYLVKYRNKHQAAAKSRKILYNRPYPRKVLHMKDHKKALKLLKSSKFIRKATAGRYRHWRQLPASSPAAIADKLNELHVFSKKGEAYTVPLVTKLLAHMKQNDLKQGPRWIVPLIASILFLTMVFGIGYNVYWSATPVKKIQETITQTEHANRQAPKVNPQRIKQAIAVWERKAGREVYQWRTQQIMKYIDEERMTDTQLLQKVHQFNTQVQPYD